MAHLGRTTVCYHWTCEPGRQSGARPRAAQSEPPAGCFALKTALSSTITPRLREAWTGLRLDHERSEEDSISGTDPGVVDAMARERVRGRLEVHAGRRLHGLVPHGLEGREWLTKLFLNTASDMTAVRCHRDTSDRVGPRRQSRAQFFQTRSARDAGVVVRWIEIPIHTLPSNARRTRCGPSACSGATAGGQKRHQMSDASLRDHHDPGKTPSSDGGRREGASSSSSVTRQGPSRFEGAGPSFRWPRDKLLCVGAMCRRNYVRKNSVIFCPRSGHGGSQKDDDNALLRLEARETGWTHEPPHRGVNVYEPSRRSAEAIAARTPAPHSSDRLSRAETTTPTIAVQQELADMPRRRRGWRLTIAKNRPICTGPPVLSSAGNVVPVNSQRGWFAGLPASTAGHL